MDFSFFACYTANMKRISFRLKAQTRSDAYFKPIHFIILIVVDICILAGTIIPQQSRLSDVESQLEEKQKSLNDIKIEYERELANLEYMKTSDYKLQQGSIKYGWHYEDDVIIPDSTE